jgi:hypothetical protein
MRCVAALLAAAAVVSPLAGCGGTAGTPPPAAEAKREWTANISVVIGQLRNDVAQTQLVGVTPLAARDALRDESTLYALLVAYSDLAGCRHIVASAGGAPAGAARIDGPLGTACRHLERAASLFTEATTHDDSRPLVAATREARRALPALVRAGAALDTFSHS